MNAKPSVITLSIVSLLAIGASVHFAMQLNQTQSDWDQLRVEVAKLQTETERQAAQIASATSDRDQLKNQAQQLAARANALAADNAKEQQDIQRASMPELPVSVTFRSSVLGHGKVAIFSNRSKADMAIVVGIVDAATHGQHAYRLNVNAGRVTQFGANEGYAFEPGDRMLLTHDGFKPLMASVPP
jgi:septal ring factor EnvC (AmiA/AmiB activator)